MVPKQLEGWQCFSFTIIFLLDYGISGISYGKKRPIKIVWFAVYDLFTKLPCCILWSSMQG